VLPTHYLDEAAEPCDRIALIAAGRIVAVGDPTPWAAGPRRPPVGLGPSRGSAPHVETQRSDVHYLALAGEFGGEIPGLTVHQPTIEDSTCT